MEISKEELQTCVKTSKSFREVGRHFNISNQKAKKLILNYGINYDHFICYRDYTNKKFNFLTIIQVYDGVKRRKYCVCRCDCGKEGIKKRLDAVISGKVPSCGCISHNRPNMYFGNNPAFAGIGELTGKRYWNIKEGAKRRSIEFNVTKEYLWSLYLTQGKKCALSGVDLYFGRDISCHNTNASLDRIDSKIGYLEGNVQWVLKDINKLKHDFDEEYFIKLCGLVYLHKGPEYVSIR